MERKRIQTARFKTVRTNRGGEDQFENLKDIDKLSSVQITGRSNFEHFEKKEIIDMMMENDCKFGQGAAFDLS